MCAKSPLRDLIAAEISAHGPLPFARFMELALYQPGLGYYSSGSAAIGRGGDFFTSVSVGSVFGKLLAGQCEEMWRRLDHPREFSIVEQGAHDGRLAGDILDSLGDDFAASARYWIVEPSPVWRKKQAATLQRFSRVRWATSVEDLPPFSGVHLSNELVDALPFHLMRAGENGWDELFVTVNETGFSFIPQPPSPGVSPAMLPARAVGTLAELRPAAAQWLQSVESRLIAGFILIIDYGYGRAQLYADHRTKGTFACYRQHRRDDDLLAHAGEKDITSHVDFTQLVETAQTAGLTLEGFTDQHHFLVGAATSLLHSLEGKPLDAPTQKTLRALQTLLHPESMGTQFRYLAFSKAAQPAPGLTGFQHARNAFAELLAPTGV